MLWARFAQPSIVICDDPALRSDLIQTLTRAAAHFMQETAPLFKGEVSKDDLWQRGLCESYKTELRPANAQARSKLIVNNHSEHYRGLATALFDEGNSPHSIYLSDAGMLRRNACRLRWFYGRLVGKPIGAFRVMKAVFTFEAGLDYVLEKIKSHSGAEIEVSDRARKYPLLYAPVMAWQLFRKGAFR